MINQYNTNIIIYDNNDFKLFINTHNTHVYQSAKILNITTSLFDESIFNNGKISILISDINSNLEILYIGCRLIEYHINEDKSKTLSINMENHLLNNCITNKDIIDNFKLKFKMSDF